MKKILLLFIATFLFITSYTHAESTKQVPKQVQCILVGTGAGYCRIILPNNIETTCSNKNMVAFNPETSVLGKEIYSMALAAVSSKKTLEISFLDTCQTSAATIDWIKYGE